jgi:hypothetical protein
VLDLKTSRLSKKHKIKRSSKASGWSIFAWSPGIEVPDRGTNRVYVLFAVRKKETGGLG